MTTEQLARKMIAIKYLKALLESVESGDIELQDFVVVKGVPDRDREPYKLNFEMTVVGSTMPLYELAQPEGFLC